jgi:two-component system LytT family response regulator
MFNEKKGIIILELEEIVFIKASLTSSVLTLTSGEEIVVKTSFNQTLETINNTDFVRVNRSFCININYLRKIDKRNLKCIMNYNEKIWEVPASKNTITHLEKLNTFPFY